MIRRSCVLMCSLILMTFFPTLAFLQEQTAPSTTSSDTPASEAGRQKQPEPVKEAAEPGQQRQGELITPPEGKTASAPAPAAPSNEETPGTYTVKQGDTLWDISTAYLKDPFLWPLLWKANPSITDPDLIYPGAALVIPSLAPIERAMKPEEAGQKKETVAEEHAPQPAPQEEGEAPPPAAKPTPAQPAAEEAAAPARRQKIIAPEQEAVPVMDKYSMLNAGFINEEESDDRIIESPEHKRIMGYDDVVYVSIQAKETTNVGDKFIIFEPLKTVKHPLTGARYGKLVKVYGILQITAKDPSSSALLGRITLSFDACGIGSKLTPYQEPVLVYNPAPGKSKEIAGYIIEVTDRRSISAQTDIVYLGVGNAEGVEPGDRFTVYDETGYRSVRVPRIPLGKVQVFLVKEHTATAVVLKSSDTISTGDRVEYEK